jgi:hypothetical protein
LSACEEADVLNGHGFSRAAKVAKQIRALVPGEMLAHVLNMINGFSASEANPVTSRQPSQAAMIVGNASTSGRVA